MKILSSTQLKEAERQTMVKQSISGNDLIERAAQALFDNLSNDFHLTETTTIILCGAGNNGGDGLALARLFYQAGYACEIYLQLSNKYSSDNLLNQTQLRQLNVSCNPLSPDTLIEIPTGTLIIDALFGVGLNRPLAPEWHQLFQPLNQQDHTIIAVDMPSGLLADQVTDLTHPILAATTTYTFTCPKLALLLPDYAAMTGDVYVLDIKLDPTTLTTTETSLCYNKMDSIASLLMSKPSRFAHKGTFGHVLIVGGSYGKIGSIVLSSRAALHTGCGLVTTYIPRCGYTILQTAFPEAMTQTDDNETQLTTALADLQPYTAIAIGMGMDQREGPEKALFEFLTQLSNLPTSIPIVLDADAINILALHPEWLAYLPVNSIITPHPKELTRLIGKWKDDFHKIEMVRFFARKNQLIVIVKGAHTLVVFPDGDLHFNSTGNWGMATAGSGDVLSGILSSLLAQGYTSATAAIVGVFIHGLAGDIATENIHAKSLIASDIIHHLSAAWRLIAIHRDESIYP